MNKKEKKQFKKLSKQQEQTQRQIKMSLRDHSKIKAKNFIEYDEDEQLNTLKKKSVKWWQKVNKRYFQKITKQDFDRKRNYIQHQYQLNEQQIVPLKQKTYYYKNILSKQPKLFQKKNIKVLFQNNQSQGGNEQYCFMTYYFGCNEQNQYEEQIIITQEEQTIKLLNKNYPKQRTARNIQITYMKNKYQILKSANQLQTQSNTSSNNNVQTKETINENEVSLIFNRKNTDLNYLNQCLLYDLVQDDDFNNQIDKQLYLWQEQLANIQAQNQSIWQKKIKNFLDQNKQNKQNYMLQKICNGYDVQNDVGNIKKQLQWKHNLINIKNGFSDKTIEMLAEALQGMWTKQFQSSNNNVKKKFMKSTLASLIVTKAELTVSFETDCKICFSTYVSQTNKVIYCDTCNESFHQRCYGLQNIQDDPDAPLYCDVCLLQQKANKKVDTTIQCRLCYIPFTPLKKIGTIFFHPLCLFLNNLLKPKQGNLQLEDEISPGLITEKVKIFEKKNKQKPCQFCMTTNKKGIRFKCSENGCKKHYHLICAYLNGVHFNIWRQKDKLQLKIKCSSHFPDRQEKTQIFLRRFFCNYKGVSDLSQNQFLQIYKEQIEELQNYKKGNGFVRIKQEEKIVSQKTQIQKQLQKRQKSKQKSKIKDKLNQQRQFIQISSTGDSYKKQNSFSKRVYENPKKKLISKYFDQFNKISQKNEINSQILKSNIEQFSNKFKKYNNQYYISQMQKRKCKMQNKNKIKIKNKNKNKNKEIYQKRSNQYCQYSMSQSQNEFSTKKYNQSFCDQTEQIINSNYYNSR